MSKIKLVLVYATFSLNLVLFSSIPQNEFNLAIAQNAYSFELGVEYPEGSGSGCVALCGGPGADCMMAGQYPVSCEKPNQN